MWFRQMLFGWPVEAIIEQGGGQGWTFSIMSLGCGHFYYVVEFPALDLGVCSGSYKSSLMCRGGALGVAFQVMGRAARDEWDIIRDCL